MKKYVIIVIVLIGLISWQCSKMISEPSLKQSVEDGVAKINNAISVISETKGYQLMSVTGDEPKLEAEYNDSIKLDMIAGVYDYQPESFYCNHYRKSMWLFKKTGESDSMIVNLPQRMIFHPAKYLHYITLPETTPENDFVIAASDYHFYYSLWSRYDYKLKADFTLGDEELGSLDVMAAGESFANHSYSSKFNFTEDYSVNVSYETGDTMTSSFALMEADDTLLKETVTLIWKDFHKIEKKYTLTLGDVAIVKQTGVDSIQVFLNGVLQKEAAAFITDDSEPTHSICHKRDILLTFDDGTTAKLSELIGPAKTKLRTLVSSMHSMYFAKNVVDHIALTIYYHSHD